jgi:hypothetical protein
MRLFSGVRSLKLIGPAAFEIAFSRKYYIISGLEVLGIPPSNGVSYHLTKFQVDPLLPR